MGGGGGRVAVRAVGPTDRQMRPATTETVLIDPPGQTALSRHQRPGTADDTTRHCTTRHDTTLHDTAGHGTGHCTR